MTRQVKTVAYLDSTEGIFRVECNGDREKVIWNASSAREVHGTRLFIGVYHRQLPDQLALSLVVLVVSSAFVHCWSARAVGDGDGDLYVSQLQRFVLQLVLDIDITSVIVFRRPTIYCKWQKLLDFFCTKLIGNYWPNWVWRLRLR